MKGVKLSDVNNHEKRLIRWVLVKLNGQMNDGQMND